jgi:hypothetical protein
MPCAPNGSNKEGGREGGREGGMDGLTDGRTNRLADKKKKVKLSL